ncbi:BlaI/MecI/CopY family transcriptional regulator [Shewanella waksmanii]|uniref:BlaI/MecI/CopY family transcriptional regulator n=1 Tax=Shewanella waksmanii TaxID=213783 RepID=UPI00048B6A00|nr:BlaI/MecI/CopY family transcriptional regulator [Shewanella waksmanii]
MQEISNSELAVLNVLWHHSPLNASEIVNALAAQQMHEKTVKTLLNRLVKKQAIGFEKQGRAYLYQPLINQNEYQIKQSKTFIERVFGGNLSPLIAGFAKHNELNEKDIAELKSVIEQWEKEQK